MQQAEEDNQKHSKTIYDRCIQNYVQRVTTWHLPIHLQSFLVDLLHASNCFLVICPTYRVATRENSHNIPWRKKVFLFFGFTNYQLRMSAIICSWGCCSLLLHFLGFSPPESQNSEQVRAISSARLWGNKKMVEADPRSWLVVLIHLYWLL